MSEVIASQVGRLAFEVDDTGLRKFDKSLQDVEKSTEDATTRGVAFGTFLGNLATQALDLSLAVGKAALAIGKDLTVGFAENGAELDAWARKMGVNVQELQRLQFAGQAVGAETDNVREAIKTLEENLGEMRRVGTGPAVESLATLGLTLADLEGKGPTEQLEIFADAMNRLPTQAERISVALEIMGEDGGALLPLFEQGAEGVRRLTERADELGIVLDEQAIASAKSAKLALGELQAVATGAGNTLATKLAPKVTELAERGVRWYEANQQLIDQKLDAFADGLVEALEGLVTVVETVIDVGSTLVDTFGGVEGAMMAGAAAVGIFAIAMGGIPGIVAAASAAIAIGISELAGFRTELRALAAEVDNLEWHNRRVQEGTTAGERLLEAQESGRLGGLTESQYQRDVESLTAAMVARGDSEADIERRLAALDRAREKQAAPIRERQAADERARQDRADRMAEARALEPELRKRLEARAKKKGIKVNDQMIETAVAKYRQAIVEGSDTGTAAKAAAASLEGMGGYSKPKTEVDTTRAQELFGGELASLARASGVGQQAIDAALKAAAQQLEAGAAQEVARNAAIGQISTLSGIKLQPGGIDQALFGMLTNIGGPQAVASAAAGARFVQVQNTWNFSNTFELQLPDGFGDGLGRDLTGVAGQLQTMLTEQWTAVIDRFSQGPEP